MMTSTTPPMPEPFAAHWDEGEGLWRTPEADIGFGEKARLATRRNAWMLVLAGMADELERVPAARVLQRVASAQATDGPAAGNFWWGVEDGKVTDVNALFFTGLGLAALRLRFADRLEPDALQTLDRMLDAGQAHLVRGLEPLDEHKLRYPNARLGEVVLSYLIAQVRAQGLDAASEKLHTALAYYRDSPWGWGEHLSDGYAKVIQAELTMIELHGDGLPEATRALNRSLLQQLIDLDAAYEGGPRVPTIRCYRMDSQPSADGVLGDHFVPWLELIRVWPDRFASKPNLAYTVAGLAHRAKLHERLAPTPQPPRPRRVTTPCVGDVSAMATVTDPWRLGAIDAYPLRVDLNRSNAGLHWQSMPVAFWHRAGDWAYLQWEAEEDGVKRALPAYARHQRPSCVLSDRDESARVGLTRSVRAEAGSGEAAAFLVLRVMPTVAEGWTHLVDRWRHLDPGPGDPKLIESGPWRSIRVERDGCVLTVGVMPLFGAIDVDLQEQAGEMRLDAAHRLDEAARPGGRACLWWIAAGPASAPPPEIDIASLPDTPEALDRLAPVSFDAGHAGFRTDAEPLKIP